MSTHKHEAPTAGKAVADKVSDNKQSASVQNEAAGELAKEALKQEGRLSTGTESDAEPTAQSKYLGSDEIMLFAPLLDLGIDAFEDRLADKEHVLPEEKVYGLLALERNGQNRTPFVKAMMKKLGLKKEDLPGGGPDYTNDVTPTSKL